MSDLNYYIAEGAKVNTVVAMGPEGPVTVISTHPNYNAIVEGLRAGDETVFELFDIEGGVKRRFRQVSERVSWDGTDVLWDGDPVHHVLARQVARLIENGEDAYEALIKFWEKLESNPNKHSREQAFDFLAAHSFQINEEGDVIGYKGVASDGNGGYTSVNRSQVPDKPSAFVDGVAVPPLSTVPNNVGTVVSMPRAEVTHDPNRTCERGLHVSTHSYAQSWSRNGTTVQVSFNPRDIVSVPNHSGGEKVRVHRYHVDKVMAEAPTSNTVLASSTPAWSDVGTRV